MDERLKQRLVGAAVLVSLVVIIAPMVLDKRSETDAVWQDSDIPPRPENVFRAEIEPVREAEILDDFPNPAAVPEPVPAPADRKRSPAMRGDAAARSPAKPASHSTTDELPRGGLGAWAVQLGSFSNSSNALALRDRLRARGYPAFIEGVRVDDREVMRVYVGPELLRAKAAESRRRLEQETRLKGMIVRYPTS